MIEVLVFFFFKQKTAYEIYQCDWSSDVCSSDLKAASMNQTIPLCPLSCLPIVLSAPFQLMARFSL